MSYRIYFGTYSQYSYPLYSRPEATSYVMLSKSTRQSNVDKTAKIGDPRLNYSWEIRFKVVGDGISMVNSQYLLTGSS